MDIETMKVLCEPTRCRILMLLSKKAYCVSALASLLELSVPAVSQHLRLLREAGLVISEKYSYQTHYRLDKKQIARVANGLLELAKDKPNHCHKNGFSCDAADVVGCRNGKAKERIQDA